MLDEKMKGIAEENGISFPYKVKTLTHNHDERIIATPLLRFYLNLGMTVDHIFYAIQYQEEKPFKKFVDDLVEVRINAVGVNEPKAARAKFTMNSAIGRFSLNLLKQRKSSI